MAAGGFRCGAALALLSLVLACGRVSSRSAEHAAGAATAADKSIEERAGQAPAANTAAPAQLDRAFFSTNLGNGRLIAYSMELAYRGESLVQSRNALLELIPRHGFLVSESAAAGENGSLRAVIKVRSSQLTAALADLDRLGKLVSESIQAEDLTEEDFRRQVKQRRETLRVQRRLARSQAADPDGRNAASSESSLSASEDRMDEADVEAWRLKDRIAWTQIALSVSFPEPAVSLSKPPFRDLGVRIAGAALWILYGVAFVLPILLVLALLFGGIGAALWYGVLRFFVRWIRRAKSP